MMIKIKIEHTLLSKVSVILLGSLGVFFMDMLLDVFIYTLMLSPTLKWICYAVMPMCL